jgi:hypothetical protein
MPYFGQELTPEQIQMIVDYERGLVERVHRELAASGPPGAQEHWVPGPSARVTDARA